MYIFFYHCRPEFLANALVAAPIRLLAILIAIPDVPAYTYLIRVAVFATAAATKGRVHIVVLHPSIGNVLWMCRRLLGVITIRARDFLPFRSSWQKSKVFSHKASGEFEWVNFDVRV